MARRGRGRDRPPPPGEELSTREEATAFLAALTRIGDERGYAAENDKHEALDLRLDALVSAIAKTPALTLAGLGVKARAIGYSRPELWREAPADMDWPDEVTRDLLESICAMLGLPDPSMPVSA